MLIKKDVRKPPEKKGLIYSMSAQQERAWEAKAERDLAGHPGLRNGRDFRWNTFRYQQRVRDELFDETFPEAPGSPGWKNKKFCPDCDRVRSMCRC